MKWTSSRVYVPLCILVIGLLVVLVLLLARPKSPKYQAKTQAWPVKILTLTEQSLSPQISLYGKVESPRYARLDAAITSYVEKTFALTGKKVAKGQLLIQLDDQDAAILYRQRTAEVKDIAAQINSEKLHHASNLAALKHEQSIYKLSYRELQRLKKLELRKYISLTDLDRAIRDLKKQELVITQRRLALKNHQYRLNQINAKLERAQSLKKQAEVDLQRTKITAPFQGQIVKLNVSVGDRIQPGEPLIEIYDYHTLEIKVQVPERWITALRKNLDENKAIYAVGIYHKKNVPMILKRLSSTIATGQGALSAYFRLPPKIALPLGASLTVIVNLPKIQKSFAVDSSAIYNNNRIYLIVAGRLQAVPIENIGHHYKSNGYTTHLTIIQSPQLKTGDKVLVTHLPNAITGLKVTPTNEKRTY